MTDTVASTATSTVSAPAYPDLRLVAVDLYRDVHKGIRAELFAITGSAGAIDPSDRRDRAALTDHVIAVAGVLESHAHHEDAVIDPVLAEHLPGLGARVSADHARLETRFGRVVEMAQFLVDAPSVEQRRLGHWLHLELAAFTSDYLVHQDLEERDVMVALERAVGVEAVADMHGAIVGSIPPDELARSLAFMLPAMNVFDRVEMLTGIRMAAPPEAFEAVVGLARSVLQPADFAALATALGIA